MNNSELKNKPIQVEILEENKKKKKKKKRKKSSTSNRAVKYIPNPWMYGSMFGLGIPAFPMMRPDVPMPPFPGKPGPHGPHDHHDHDCHHDCHHDSNPAGDIAFVPSVDVKGAGPMSVDVVNTPEASMPAAPAVDAAVDVAVDAAVAAPVGGMGESLKESEEVLHTHEVHQSGRIDLVYNSDYKYQINLEELEDELSHKYDGEFFIEYITKNKEDDTLRISFTNDAVVETLATDDEVELQSENFIDGQALIDDLCSSEYLDYEFDVIDYEFTNCDIDDLDLVNDELITDESLDEVLPRQR